MSDINFSRGLPETVLDHEPSEALAALAAAEDAKNQVVAIAEVCSRWPSVLTAWASLGDVVDEKALAYAAYRTGYHRGLDRLRANGWRGSGYVRWHHETNRGFLRSLVGLRDTAKIIGETQEEQRCTLFLHQLDPEWYPRD